LSEGPPPDRGADWAALLRLLGQKFQIHPPIVVDEEHILPVVAPLRNVMGTPGRNCPRKPWHDATLPSPHAAVNPKIG